MAYGERIELQWMDWEKREVILYGFDEQVVDRFDIEFVISELCKHHGSKKYEIDWKKRKAWIDEDDPDFVFWGDIEDVVSEWVSLKYNCLEIIN